MKLYRTVLSYLVEQQGRCYSPKSAPGDDRSWDSLVTRDDLYGYLQHEIQDGAWKEEPRTALQDLRAPIGTQEVWAAGVTYYRSREARIQESKVSGGGDFYDRVYDAERPELFFKATAHRVVGPGRQVAIRDDSSWSVPEPELALLISPRGRVVGYTVGNDMSSRSIEGENPLYLPQAKVYERSCGLGPCVLITQDPLSPSTEISMEILRGGKKEFTGATLLSRMKRDAAVLVQYLVSEQYLPQRMFSAHRHGNCAT
jgi:2-dehydro-3-deoxy-D-arabinonate dehydratase